jgi:hypothetical protein
VAPDEEARFQRYAEQFVAFQRRLSERYGTGRALHRKQLLALTARLEVPSDIVDHARHGVFARPGSYEARVRLSNSSMHVRRDASPDIRGFGLKVLGVSGPGALGGKTNTQDFALISIPNFQSPSAERFAGLIVALAKGTGPAFRYLVRRNGPVGALRVARRSAALLKAPFSGFATHPFHSAAAIAVGPYAARVRLLPRRSDAAPFPGTWAADMRRHLETGDVIYDVQLQFYTDDLATPIENPNSAWPEAASPFVTVARLTVPSQETEGDASRALAAEVERSVFDPWNALMDHRPLGDVMRARKVVYYASEHERGAA